MTQSKPQQPSRRHHYIPAFYTDRWTTEGKLIEYLRIPTKSPGHTDMMSPGIPG